MLITVDEVRSDSKHADEFKDMTDEQVTRYIIRAERYIVGATGVDYPTIQDLDESTKAILNTTTLLLVDLLYSRDNDAEYQRIAKSGMQSERLGDYSYSRGSSSIEDAWGTGDMEIDNLLHSLMPDLRAVPIFETSGKAAKRKQGGGHYGFF